MNKKMDFKCKSWSTDTSKFTLPSAVTFTDFSKMVLPSVLPSGNTSLPDLKANKCAACDDYEGEAQVQCKIGLGC